MALEIPHESVQYGPVPVKLSQGENAFFTFHINANGASYANVQAGVQLFDAANNLVAKLSGAATPNGDGSYSANLTWSGAGLDGSPLPPGNYAPTFTVNGVNTTTGATDSTSTTACTGIAVDPPPKPKKKKCTCCDSGPVDSADDPTQISGPSLDDLGSLAGILGTGGVGGVGSPIGAGMQLGGINGPFGNDSPLGAGMQLGGINGPFGDDSPLGAGMQLGGLGGTSSSLLGQDWGSPLGGQNPTQLLTISRPYIPR